MLPDEPTLTADTAQLKASVRKIESLLRYRIAEASQAAVAEALDVSPSTVARIVSGETGVVLERIGPLFGALGLTVLTREELAALRLFASKGLGNG